MTIRDDYQVGQRVHELERVNDLCKIVRIDRDDSGRKLYVVRQFAHPHLVFVTDAYHLGSPRGKTHDGV